jgi:hypothetical protein
MAPRRLRDWQHLQPLVAGPVCPVQLLVWGQGEKMQMRQLAVGSSAVPTCVGFRAPFHLPAEKRKVWARQGR